MPTALACHGNFYAGNLNTFPVVAGSSNIYKITPSGNIKVFIRGLTTVLGVAFDSQNRMYVLETTTVSGDGPTPGTGAVVRVSRSGALETIASGLTFPSGMTFWSRWEALSLDVWLWLSARRRLDRAHHRTREVDGNAPHWRGKHMLAPPVYAHTS